VFVLAGDTPKPAPAGTLVVIDAAGKEQPVKAWTFTAGVRRLAWLAPRDKTPAKKEAAGPEALVVRDDEKIFYVDGALTLVPLDRLRSVEFDTAKSLMTVRVAAGGKAADVVLVGTTRYKGINKLTLEAEVDKGDAGVAALTYQGGVPRGIRAVRFPEPKVAEEKHGGRPAVVLTEDKTSRKAHPVTDLAALYQLGPGQETLSPTLMFRKTLKVDVAKVKKISRASESDGRDVVWQVEQKDGDDSTLTLLTTITLEGKSARLVGLLGKVPAGYRLFPPLSIAAVHFDATEAPKEKEKENKEDKGR
jgi:hypothetical protein